MLMRDLVNEVRFDYLDDDSSSLWSDAQLLRDANEAISEAFQRAPLLLKTSTLTIVAATAEYSIDPSIRLIYTAKLDLINTPLEQSTDAQLSLMFGSSWRVNTGTPVYYVRTGHKIRLYPIPIVNDSLVLNTTYILDYSQSMLDDLDDFIDLDYQKSLVHFFVYKAKSLRDIDTYDPVKAQEHLTLFDNMFGLKKTAKYNSVSFETPMYATISSGRMA